MYQDLPSASRTLRGLVRSIPPPLISTYFPMHSLFRIYAVGASLLGSPLDGYLFETLYPKWPMLNARLAPLMNALHRGLVFTSAES